MTKIDIISGFLGAGKTTFIKKMLEEVFEGEKIVLIENEFGEIGIDGGFLKDSGIEISELNSGCICCSLVGDFGKNLREVMERFHPERILIEPSGVGKLSDVMKSVKEVEEENEVCLNGLVTVVNTAKATKQMRAFGEFFNNQIEYATVIVLSRTQNVKPEQTEAVAKAIRGKNPQAAIITTPWDEIDGKQIYKAIEQQKSLEEELMEEHMHDHEHEGHAHHGHEHGHEGHAHHGHEHGHEEHAHHDHEHEGHAHHHEHGEGCTCGCHDHHHHADEVFSSWGLENAAGCDRAKLEEILDELANGNAYGDVLRAKGMIPSEVSGKWYYFDLVPDEFEIREGEPDYTGKVCVIGARLKEEELNKAFGRS